MPPKRRICFVTGTRAEFGLMIRTLRAIQNHPRLQLQLVATGMHLDKRRGLTLKEIAKDFKVDATVPWHLPPRPVLRERAGVRGGQDSQIALAIETGLATAQLAKTFARLQSDIVLVVGDRVEAFAAASAAHLSGKMLAHVHGGDRAIGQVDDSLRHAITKLAHVHFPATAQSAQRISRLGEDKWRIHRVGSPGVEAIATEAIPGHPVASPFALVVLHPQDPDSAVESRRAKLLFNALQQFPFTRLVIIYPNNDPGSSGIIRSWNSLSKNPRVQLHRSIPRDQFLALLRDAAVLIGNSSSGIIEAASFGTPVIDIGNRQLGRERSQNVTNVPYSKTAIVAALNRIWNNGRPRRARVNNIYAAPRTAQKIAHILATVSIDSRLSCKLIAY